MRRCRGRLGATESGESAEVRRRTPEPWCLGGRREKKSDVDGEKESDGGWTNPSGRTGSVGSGGEEDWDCGGGAKERETCSNQNRVH